ncbi:hypothetical protein [Pseudosulfitobacter pseudonitzschiae]|uniref:hypothetical protein n=1 Tax=Pseudosulfitobacter pseudonitzschiae TaxID=1402135 RepID=UPI001AF26759|nr:hypothetical protein [Pseudosulfitobacter pseudonitzschiae]MBM1817403.1 hypothetical protein [Pseudosulfitobacter pseudonitzschiae]MBM1834601.1 hypothetical protein [Pseudosulfitobacter pseudonitzschiae]MBM1839465.1 hypothetical protein [Pseudosulfitobacter pseudonitzschiae]MBM1844316.1 hypothetical protein [Pseudosulfitobacter pseudonitzschiae]MBM1849150.1 hypothetical protein [Pseudosulfitobacter pseudonitzschiae]
MLYERFEDIKVTDTIIYLPDFGKGLPATGPVNVEIIIEIDADDCCDPSWKDEILCLMVSHFGDRVTDGSKKFAFNRRTAYLSLAIAFRDHVDFENFCPGRRAYSDMMWNLIDEKDLTSRERNIICNHAAREDEEKFYGMVVRYLELMRE